MRLRTSAATVVAASLAFLFTLSGTAAAATGQFAYKYHGLEGQLRTAVLQDPPSGECVTLPEVADPDASSPAVAPWNDTDAWATVYSEADCTGREWNLRPHGRPATERLELRSVMFWQV